MLPRFPKIKIIVVGIFGQILFALSISAQVSPIPVTDAEVRDNTSTRMRSLEFERTKREANQLHPTEATNSSAFRFAEIKEDFENIQELQAAIVKAYETGAKIDYGKIGEFAFEMKKRATRLRANFFGRGEATDKDKDSQPEKPKTVRDLIIELDGTLAAFIGSPIFASAKVINAKSAGEARAHLERIIRLSAELEEGARKMTR